MNLERTPLLLEARMKSRATLHRAADVERFRTRKAKRKGHKRRGVGKQSLLKRLRKGHKKRPHSHSTITREMDAPPTMPSIGMTMAGPGSFGPVSVGGVMRHS